MMAKCYRNKQKDLLGKILKGNNKNLELTRIVFQVF